MAVVKDLIPFLPVPRVEKENDTYSFITNCPDTIGRMHTFYGHFGVMVRALAYILSMGGDGLKRASQLAVLNANYIKESLKTTLDLPYDRPCMHECVFTDKSVQEHHISTMDMAKRLLDYGFHPPTVYFPLVVDAAFMVEPTETESKDDIDQFIDAVKAIVKEAASNPEKLKSAPYLPKVTRLDEVTAARKPCLKG